jgi:outer membrane protein assembly factor BamB
MFVGSSEGRLYSIDLARGSTNFEELVTGRIDVAATVESVAGFGESGQSQTLAFLGNDAGSLVARKLGDTGEVVWRFQMEGPLSGPPIVFEQTVYAAGGGHVYAIDGPGGFEVSRFPESPVEGGFTEALAADDTYLYAVGGGDLYMLDLETLEAKCVVDLPARTQIVTHPVLADGAVFVGTGLRTIAVFSPGNCGVPPPGFLPSHQIEVPIRYAPVVRGGTIWMAADELVLALDALSSDFEFVDVGGLITSPPVLADDTLIMAIEGGELVGVDVASRTVAWRFDVDAEVRAPVAVVDRTIVVATARGDLKALAGN